MNPGPFTRADEKSLIIQQQAKLFIVMAERQLHFLTTAFFISCIDFHTLSLHVVAGSAMHMSKVLPVEFLMPTHAAAPDADTRPAPVECSAHSVVAVQVTLRALGELHGQ